ncbi:uncharacterized protein LOC116174012 [Photinus pyralis]|uniref:uncharacterized protein LOC116174012 n=1 Tax=Photinus pyralis TaxID=7054 RepID=UPI001266F8DE|nr:uncharacterized protein LOC116174012 [Photinus pyralis]
MWSRVSFAIFPVLWLVMLLGELIILLRRFTRIKSEAKKTVEIMEHLEGFMDKLYVQHLQVQLFSLQVYVNDFKFDIFGCFPLDWTLLRSMASGITTYWIIFHQFSHMEKHRT